MSTASPSHLVAAALDAKELAGRLPQRLDKVMDSLAEGELRLSVDRLDEADIMRSVQKLANRGAAGLAIAVATVRHDLPQHRRARRRRRAPAAAAERAPRRSRGPRPPG